MDIGDLRFARHQTRAASHQATKVRLILESLEKHRDRAFFSKDIANSLEDSGVRISNIMLSVRRFERQGFIYVRGYRMHDRQTPFKEGYLLTWLDPGCGRPQVSE